MQAQDLLPSINEFLSQQGVSARVVVKGKDLLEIRLEVQDAMTTEFAIKRPKVRTHATTRAERPMAPVVKKEAPRNGFNLKLVSHTGSMSDDDLSTLHSLTQKYPFISVTKLNSGVWESMCREIVWLASGLFVDSHKWDSAWLTKTEQKGGGPAFLRNRFKDIPSVIKSICDCLDYVNEAHSKGVYWWPVVVKGKIPRQSIASFIVSTTRAGTDWSPFCEVLWELNKDVALKSALPKLAVAVAETIIKDSDYLRNLPSNSMAPYWVGLKKFTDWYYSSRDSLMANVDNRVRLADVGAAVTLVKEWNMSASGRALPMCFIYPGSDKWFRFTQWCKSYRNVIIPDYRLL